MEIKQYICHAMKIKLILIYLLVANSFYAQKNYSLSTLDSLFIQNNLILLAKKYNVDAQKAFIKQAQLLDNPNLYIEQNIFNSNNNKYFDISNQGEYIFQVQQIIKTAGKRSKSIELAKLNYQISQTEFEYLISELIFQMHSTFYQLYFLNKIKDIFQNEINELEPLIQEYEKQNAKGNVSLREVIRLRGILFNLQSITSQIIKQIEDLKKDLSVYTGLNISDNINFKIDSIQLKNIDDISIVSLVDTALKYRADYLNTKHYYELARTNYRLQKSLAIPDLTLGYTFDKAGNFILNYSGLSLGMNLPFFNRNQGNIKASEFLVKQSETDIRQKEREIRQEIFSAFEKLKYTQQLYASVKIDFLKNFDSVKDGMRENFKKRNISILEYADFFDAYINSVQQYYSLVSDYYTQVETLNFYLGKKIIK